MTVAQIVWDNLHARALILKGIFHPKMKLSFQSFGAQKTFLE